MAPHSGCNCKLYPQNPRSPRNVRRHPWGNPGILEGGAIPNTGNPINSPLTTLRKISSGRNQSNKKSEGVNDGCQWSFLVPLIGDR